MRNGKEVVTDHGITIVYTGDGKGKTTAALGLCFRALGYGMKCAIVQFIKSNTSTGEYKFAENTPLVEIHTMGDGFVYDPNDADAKAAAVAAWNKAKALITDPKYDVIILDEITYAFKLNFLSVNELISVLSRRPASMSVVITGRNCPQEIMDVVDLVTEMKMQKHPFNVGKKAVRGIDF
ncbi:MAG: cob(I)yrinic acid a,c-diamide adenosyltransferase [Oligoflexia bacterium]|nr:cob(I)yrinic acid a,c-diamide adenosyltransferase [Oligoflexia bacterium]MBF0365815.1 cob(I)yrinic acid a,c-diamide adenosyltransferase [Oligoflexia bacterium]